MSLFERLIHCLQEGYDISFVKDKKQSFAVIINLQKNNKSVMYGYDIKLLKHAGEGELISLLIAMVEEMRMNGE